MKHLVKLGAVAVSVISAGCLTLGMGIASADTITNTGPGSYNAILSKSSSFETIHNINVVNLNNRNYQTAITGAASVNNNTNSNDEHHNHICQPKHTYSYLPSHQVYSTMPAHYVQPRMNEGYNSNNYGGQGGNAASGNASNYNATAATVDVTNTLPASDGMNNHDTSSISNTGPHSFNLISARSSQDTEIVNTNNVSIDNTNSQTAISGNANVSGNTRGGSAVTGDATNVNSTRFDVSIMNQ